MVHPVTRDCREESPKRRRAYARNVESLVRGELVTRQEPPFDLAERPMLEAWLEYHRATLEWKCASVGDEQLKARAVPPSAMSLLGLVRHMAAVEEYWFRRCFARETESPTLYYSDADPNGDFDNVDDAEVDEAFATWRAECEHSVTITRRATSLDEVGIKERDSSEVSLRWILVHMIEEYARHNGHADLLRECIDGAVGA